MEYYKQILQPSEIIKAVGKLSWIIYLPGIVFSFIFGVILILAGIKQDAPLVALSILFGLVEAILVFSSWTRGVGTELVVTDQRVIYKTGVFSRRTIEMNIRQIESVDVRQSVLGRVFNYGTIVIKGTGATFEPLRDVEDPLAFRKAIVAG